MESKAARNMSWLASILMKNFWWKESYWQWQCEVQIHLNGQRWWLMDPGFAAKFPGNINESMTWCFAMLCTQISQQSSANFSQPPIASCTSQCNDWASKHRQVKRKQWSVPWLGRCRWESREASASHWEVRRSSSMAKPILHRLEAEHIHRESVFEGSSVQQGLTFPFWGIMVFDHTHDHSPPKVRWSHQKLSVMASHATADLQQIIQG